MWAKLDQVIIWKKGMENVELLGVTYFINIYQIFV